MAYSKNRRLADLVATDGTMDAAKLKSGTVTQAHLHSSHGITTAHITEGSNKYYTDERVDDRSNSLLQDGANITLTYNDSAGTLTVAATDTNTTYSAGTGLALSSTTFSLSHLGLQSLSDPNADRIAFWDDSAGAFAWLTIGSNLTVSGTTLSGVAAYGDSDARAAISVTDAGGDGSCSYNSSSGVITYTGPSAAEVRAHLSAGTGVTYSGGAIAIGQAVSTSSNVTFADLAATGNVTVTGNLTVNGTQTTLSTATLDVEDKNITLNKGSGDTSASADGAGITIQDAVNASTDATLTWNASNDNFVFSHEVVAPSLDISGNVDIDGTLETDALTINGTTSVPFESADHTKSDGIAASANNYSLPLGTSSARGGFKIGYTESGKNYPVELSSEQMYVNVPWTDTNTTYSTATSSALGLVKIGYTESGKNYPVELSSGQMFVNVPWTDTDTNTTYSVGDGGLTQNNFTNTLKTKLDAIEASATADQSAAEILTAVKTVDGSGSGLDADLLDGVDSGLYFKSQTNNNGGWSQSNRNFSVRSGGDAVGLHMEESDGTFGFQLYGNGGTYGFLDGEWSAWDIQKASSGAFKVDVGSGLVNVATEPWVQSQGYATSAASLSATQTFTGSNSFSNSYNEFGNGVGSVSNDGSWAARVNVAGNNHARLDVKDNTDGIIASMYAHTGHGGPRFGSLSNHPVDFMVNGSVKMRLDSNGKIYPGGDDRGYIGPVGTHDISLHSVKFITFDWDGNYDHEDYHGVFSTNSASTYTDSMAIKSFDDITLMLDTNNNDAASYMRVTNNVTNGSSVMGSIGFNGTQPIWDMPSASTKLLFSGSSTTYGIGAQGHNYNTAYLDTCDSGGNTDVLELVYYSGAGVKVGASGGTKPIYASIYYDGNSTGYYGDFAGTSNMYTIQNQNTITYPTSAGASSAEGGVSYAIFQESGAWSNPYPELQIAFHTGINFGGNASYNGMRFYSDSNMSSRVIQINGSSNYIYKDVWMHTDAGEGMYSSSRGFHLYPNTNGSYGSTQINGTHNSYSGINMESGGRTTIGMYDSGGNGGEYKEGNSKWRQYYHTSNDCLGIAGSTTSSSYRLYVNGPIYATGDIVGSSDERLKKNIHVINNGLEKVLALRGVTYEWKEDRAKKDGHTDNNITPERMGVIAQEIMDIVPEVVTYDKENDRYGVAYGHLTGLLIEAIKDLNTKVEDLEKKLEEK